MADSRPFAESPGRGIGIAGRAEAAIPAFRKDRRLQFIEKGEKFIARDPREKNAKDTPATIQSPEYTCELA
jgi:hypothetical protein